LSALFYDAGCRVTGTDFAASMLVIARQRLPEAEFILADLRDGWPVELSQPFHCAVSAYVFHHFPLNPKN
jgi:trans-aconitate methyltransferase